MHVSCLADDHLKLSLMRYILNLSYHQKMYIDLPSLADVDITSSHFEIAVKKIQGGAGPGGSTASL